MCVVPAVSQWKEVADQGSREEEPHLKITHYTECHYTFHPSQILSYLSALACIQEAQLVGGRQAEEGK